MSARFGKVCVPMTAVLLAVLACSGNPPPAYDSPPVLANREEITAAMSAVGAGLEARVVLQVRVDEEGYVREARVVQSSGMPELDDAAQWIGEKMRFKPAMHEGKPVAALVQIPVRFDVVSHVVRAPRLRNAAEVEAIIGRDYPDLRGTARFRIQVGPEGWVREVKTRQPSDREVMSAAQKLIGDWLKFSPAYKEGREITASVYLTIEFAGEYSRVYLESDET